MNEFFRVLRMEIPKDAKCLIEIDEYVPLRFRAYERPLGSSYLRLGDQVTSLVEILVDPNIGLVRGITITSFAGLTTWPQLAVGSAGQGLPVLSPSWGKQNRIDTGIGFSVSVRGSEVLLYWANLEHCEASGFHDRVQFFTVGGELAGVLFSGLSDDELKIFMAHVPSI